MEALTGLKQLLKGFFFGTKKENVEKSFHHTIEDKQLEVNYWKELFRRQAKLNQSLLLKNRALENIKSN